MNTPNSVPDSTGHDTIRQIDLDGMARAWFANFHTLTPGTAEYAQHTSSIAIARGYALEAMTTQDVEDLHATLGTLAMFSAMHAPANEGGKADMRDFAPDNETADYLNREARSIVRDIMGLAYVDHQHYQALETSYTDTMTPALNEQGLRRYLKRNFGLDNTAEQRQKRKPQEVCIGDSDLTNFKRINSVLGDKIGDEAIREAHGELEENLRLSDNAAIARYRRGDEFEIVIPQVTASNLAKIEERLMKLQIQKVSEGRYVKTWEKIYALRAKLMEAGILQERQHLPARVVMEEIDGKKTRVLYISEQSIGPLRDIVVHSIGFARGTMQTWEDHDRLHEKAMAANAARKTMLHALMGGADRKA